MENNEHILDCLQLIKSENVGPVTFYKLLEQFKTVRKAIEALPQFPKLKLFPRSAAQREFEQAQEKGIKFLFWQDPDYPQNLLQLNDAPPLLYALGDIKLLNHPVSLSVVGARNASINGRKMASKISYDLTNNHILIISGMARGIDSSAHKGAMYAQNQKGPTVAVLGTGVDVVYPSSNKELYAQIAEQGVIISELPLGSDPQVQNFPRRNRLVSALGCGTLVVEATTHSGSLITARFALEQGKDLFAVPGSPQDARALGPNKLIKEGAILVESADDILEALNPTQQKQIIEYVDNLQKNADIPALEIENKLSHKSPKFSVIEYLSHEGVYVDEIIRASGQDQSTVSLALLELELKGKIERQPGNKVALIK